MNPSEKYLSQRLNKQITNKKSPKIFKRFLISLVGIFLVIILIASFFPIYELYSNYLANLAFPNIRINSAEENSFISADLLANFSNNLKDEVLLEAPLILQYPELPRGCEVTSLAMLLNYSGLYINKMELASKIKKDPSEYQVVNGRTHFGNPDYGFVGDMYSLSNPGFGVYHGPIFELLSSYLPGQAIDLTGAVFEDLFYFLNKEIPVWVIINTRFAELSPREFEVWYTSYGPIQITYRQHAVLLTGFDAEYVYFNNPLSSQKNQRVAIETFKKGWIQMGSQAISYIPENLKLLDILPLE